MRYTIRYSPEVSQKLRDMKEQIRRTYGAEAAANVLAGILQAVRGLQENPEKGPSMEALLGIPNPYRFLHVKQNYIFYRIEGKTVYVTEMFHERENFLQRMFRVSLRSQESVDYWGD